MSRYISARVQFELFKEVDLKSAVLETLEETGNPAIPSEELMKIVMRKIGGSVDPDTARAFIESLYND
jgi:hypothetical protein